MPIDVPPAVVIEQVIPPYLYDHALPKSTGKPKIFYEITFVDLNGYSKNLREKVDDLKAILGGKYTLKVEDDTRPEKLKWGIYQDGQKVALLKTVPNRPVSSFKQTWLPENSRVMIDIPVKGPNWQRDLIAFEIDQILGLNLVPAQVGVKFKVNGTPSYGIVQTFIPNARDGLELLDDAAGEGGKMLKELPVPDVQLAAISSMINGRGAGQFANTMFQTENGKITNIYETDLEESMIPQNRLGKTSVTIGGKQLAKDLRKNVVLARSAVLGLPQNNETLDAAALPILTHPKLLSVAKRYSAAASKHYDIGKAPFTAFVQRISRMQDLAKQPITPRDLYYNLFGGKNIVTDAQKKNWPDIIIFNQIVGTPYQQYAMKGFNPATIPQLPEWKNPNILNLQSR